MIRHGRMLWVAIAMALGLMAAACVQPGHSMSYDLTGTTREIDPATGETVITYYWRYGDGATTATFERLPKGNEQRRREPKPPPARIVD